MTIESNEKNLPKVSRRRIWPGLLILAAGCLLLAREMKADIPDWIFTWQSLLMGIGIVIGFQHQFRNITWLILVAIGGFSLVDRQMPELHLHHFISPVILILLGFFFIFRRRNEQWMHQREAWRNSWKNSWRNIRNPITATGDEGEYIDSTSVFGSVKKKVLSKNFKGGDITCFMGGAEIDLSQADLQGPVVMDVTQLFGGVKLVIPGNWNIRTNVTSIFSGIEDKRANPFAAADENKTLVLDGTSVFGGIEITSYPTQS
ncbi:MAG TPA: LiaF domain-containing protein [Puia sp.]|nr:LiaF domain-containing protein [Puia sp.]